MIDKEHELVRMHSRMPFNFVGKRHELMLCEQKRCAYPESFAAVFFLLRSTLHLAWSGGIVEQPGTGASRAPRTTLYMSLGIW